VKGRRPRPLDDGDSGRPKGIGSIKLGKTNKKHALNPLNVPVLIQGATITHDGDYL